MKKISKKPIIKDCGSKEQELSLYENVIFTDISVQEIINSPISNYSDLLDLISVWNGLKCRFVDNIIIGNASDIKKAQNILINSVKYN